MVCGCQVILLNEDVMMMVTARQHIKAISYHQMFQKGDQIWILRNPNPARTLTATSTSI